MTRPVRVDPPDPGSLPSTLGAALRAEFARAVRPPYETPTVVLGNGLLMTACWTLLPASVVDLLFSFHGSLAFAMILASWMYSDVPATNLLGGDAARSIAALPDPATLRRMWYAKNLVLWLLITPLCGLIAVIIGLAGDASTAATVLAVGWIAGVPLGALGFAGWTGIWFPYHPLPLRYRWSRRRRWWPVLGRWSILVLTPYAVVPLLTTVISMPSVLLWTLTAPEGNRRRISDADFAWGLALAVVIATAAWIAGHRWGSRLAYRRRHRLTGFLADPDRG